ncbi:hypothetical protein CHU98_g5777 [Xylaria longipes]|nr:hypothetical protein CHU98_g5777 [Xylaria longipes]
MARGGNDVEDKAPTSSKREWCAAMRGMVKRGARGRKEREWYRGKTTHATKGGNAAGGGGRKESDAPKLRRTHEKTGGTAGVGGGLWREAKARIWKAFLAHPAQGTWILSVGRHTRRLVALSHAKEGEGVRLDSLESPRVQLSTTPLSLFGMAWDGICRITSSAAGLLGTYSVPLQTSRRTYYLVLLSAKIS